MARLDIKVLETKFNQLTLRERVISFVALLICTASMTYFWVIDPSDIQMVKAQKQLSMSYKQQSSIKNEIGQLKLRLQVDPLLKINNEIMALRQTITSLDSQLNLRLIKFIHANKMALALTKVLAKTPGIKVNYLTTLPVQSFDSEPTGANKEKSVLFYKHSLEVQLTGDYNAVYQYLHNLEMLQDKFYWSSLQYEVAEYPLANITLRIYTLSDQQDLVSG